MVLALTCAFFEFPCDLILQTVPLPTDKAMRQEDPTLNSTYNAV
ncbi:hypothetical protein APHNP_1716 [Anaplasma phagocytophilum str. ApNP]|uniref:Uncharacterized protein n=1 Tax=Anaplasma phagocytophilum str. ApNP TaxID=1359153 RepID=A0A0F3NF79_ANAPH|nr:hypothetical protein APHNP_1716 [Anaplasma phagocytophilum str. ApNP]